MRFFGRIFAFLLILAVLGAVFAYFGNWGFPSEAALNEELRKDFDATAHYDKVSGNPFRSFELDNLKLDSPKGFSLNAQEAHIFVDWKAILTKNPHPKELALFGGNFTLKRAKDKAMMVSLPPPAQADFTVRLSNFTYDYTDDTGPSPIPMKGPISGAIAFKGNTLHFDQLSVGALDASISLTGDYDRSTDDYRFDVAGENLSIETLRLLLVQYYGPFTDFIVDAGVDFTAKAQRRDDVFAVNGSLTSSKSFVRGFHLDGIQSEFSYSGGIFKLTNLKAGMYGGTLKLPEFSVNLQPLLKAGGAAPNYTYALQFSGDGMNIADALKDLRWLTKADLTGKLGGEFSLSGVLGGISGTTGAGYIQASEGEFPAPDGQSRLGYDLFKLEFQYGGGVMTIHHAMVTLKNDRWLGVGKLKVDLNDDSVEGRGALAMSIADTLLGALGQKSTIESFVKAAPKSHYFAMINFNIQGMLYQPDISFNTSNQPFIVFTGDSTEERLSQLWDKWTSSKFGRD